ncbi:MAG: hypothetical protein R6W69_05610 [Anaerolineales bacterium]
MFRSARFLLPVFVLLLASLACQAVTGGGDAPVAPESPVEQFQPEPTEAVAEQPAPAQEYDEPAAPAAGLSIETEFPFPADSHTCMDLGSNGVMCQSGESLKDVAAFYRAEFKAKGYTERELLTVESDAVISLVFDGHESGQAIVLQCVDLGTGSTSITLRFEDV